MHTFEILRYGVNASSQVTFFSQKFADIRSVPGGVVSMCHRFGMRPSRTNFATYRARTSGGQNSPTGVPVPHLTNGVARYATISSAVPSSQSGKIPSCCSSVRSIVAQVYSLQASLESSLSAVRRTEWEGTDSVAVHPHFSCISQPHLQRACSMCERRPRR